MHLSVVTTMYNSAAHLAEFHERTSRAARQLDEDYELIFVNDGSPDDSLVVVLALREHDDHVKVIDLSRNFGHHKAIMTGLAHARGERVFLIDCDLEEDPKWLINFEAVMNEAGADVVYGVQDGRKGGLLERMSGTLFYRLFNFLSSYPVPANVVTARLMSHRYVASLVEHRDREVFLLGLWTITGFRQVPVVVRKHSRGDTSYTLTRKLSILVNSVTSFSNKPLVYIFYLGCFISLFAALAACYLVVRRLFFGELLSGWPSIMVSIWLLGGLTIFSLGVIGIYLSRVFSETKQRPYTVIREIHERKKQP